MGIDEPAPGTTNTGGYKAAVAAGTLTADVVINVMIQERRYARNGVMPGAFVVPTVLTWMVITQLVFLVLLSLLLPLLVRATHHSITWAVDSQELSLLPAKTLENTMVET